MSDKRKEHLYGDIQAGREGAQESLRSDKKFREEMRQMFPDGRHQKEHGNIEQFREDWYESSGD